MEARQAAELFLDQANISTRSRCPKPSKLALHTTIQRFDAQRRESGDAAKWEQDLAEWRENLRQGHKKGHMLIESFVENQSLGRLAQLVRARASHARGHRFESCSAHYLTPLLSGLGQPVSPGQLAAMLLEHSVANLRRQVKPARHMPR